MASESQNQKESKFWDLRDEFIARVVRGCSFADVGGLWGTVNEKVSVAASQGAASVAMVDISAPGSELWQRFNERMSSLNIHLYDCVSSDVCKYAEDGAARQYDVVHSSGVLYHHPSPLYLLRALRRITTRYLILTSAVTQEVVSNELGIYQIPASGVLFVPALDDTERKILAKYWFDNAGVGSCYGITEKVHWDIQDFGPWWWLPTARAMVAMAECVGLRLLDSGPTWNGNAHTALLEVAG